MWGFYRPRFPVCWCASLTQRTGLFLEIELMVFTIISHFRHCLNQLGSAYLIEREAVLLGHIMVGVKSGGEPAPVWLNG